MKTRLSTLAALALLGSSYATAQTPIPLGNSSFESAADTSFNGNNYNRTTTIAPWTIDLAGNNFAAARVNQTYCDTAAVQTGPLVGAAGMWLSANGSLTQDTGVTFASNGSADYTFKVKIGQSNNFTGTDLITLFVLDGSGTPLATQAINTLNPGEDLAEFSLTYSASGTENGTIQVRITSGAGNTNGVYVVDDASLSYIATTPPSFNSENLEETVRWVNVDTQLGVGGPVQKYWEHRHDQIATAGSSKVGLVFVGDSISDLTTNDLQTNPFVLVDSANRPLYESTWAGRYKPANYGISGQVTQNIRWQIANGVYGTAAKPQVISLMIGTNNLHQNAVGSGSSPVALNDADNRLDTVAGIKAVVNDLKAWSPESEILLNSILPRNFNGNDPVSNTLVEQVNSDIALWAAPQSRVTYVDVYSLFSDGSGGINASLYTSDQLHPNTNGYQVWFDALQPLVDVEIPVGPDYIRNLDIPEHTATVPAKPEYADLETAGSAGFGWNPQDKTETWSEIFDRIRGLPLTQETEIVFLGDSVTMAWGRVGGRTTPIDRGSGAWNAANFDQYNAVNAGMSGDKIEDLLWRINNGQMDGIAKPKLLVVMIGTNNREAPEPTLTPSFDGPHSSEEIANGVLKVVQKLQALYPNTHILCHGFLRGANNTDPERIAARGANAIVEQAFQLDTNPYLHYLDLNPLFINPASANEAYLNSLTTDDIHPVSAGYTVWANAVQPFIDKYVAAANDANSDRGEDETAFDAANWQSEVGSGTTAATTQFSPINQNGGTTVDLSGISSEATYEFIVEAEDLSQTAATLLSESGNSLQLEQSSNTGLIGLTSSGTHQFSPFYGTSVSSPYGGINHLVLRVHSGEGFSHLFLNGELVGTLNRAYTFSSASAALANVADSPIGTDGEPVVHGFAAYDSLLTDAEISRHHRAAFCYDLPQVSFTDCPEDLQLYPRNPANLLAVDVPVSGTVLETGYDSVVIKLARNGVAYGSELVAPLSYSGNQASFSLTPSILPELAQYDLHVYLRRSGNPDTLVKTACNIVAGDVYLIQGQSNAYASIWDGSANENLGPYLRSFGTNPIFQSGESSNDEAQRAGYTEADTHWHYAIADEDVDNTDDDRAPGHIGQIGARIGAQLIAEHQVPIAILTGAHGGKQLSFFARNDSDVNDTQTNYGRLLWRAEQAGVEDAIRGLIFCQGENDEGIINGELPGSQTPAAYDAAFGALYTDWQSDYSIAQHYVIQMRPDCYDWIVPEDTRLRDLQRRWADTHVNLSVFSYNGISGQHSDFCHYAYSGGYQAIGDQLATAIGRDLYGVADSGNIDAPNPLKAAFSNPGKTEITLLMRDLDDTLLADAGVETYFQLEEADGTAIASPTITNVTINGHTLVLTLSGVAPANAARVGFQSHRFEVAGDYWVTNANGVGMLTFSEPIDDSLTALELWQRDVQGVPPGVSAFTDTDGDGFIELVEHALGLDPLSPSQQDSALPTLQIVTPVTDSFPQLQFQRPVNYTHLTYTVEWSNDLVEWKTGSPYVSNPAATPIDAMTEMVNVTGLLGIDDETAQFLRLVIQLQ